MGILETIKTIIKNNIKNTKNKAQYNITFYETINGETKKVEISDVEEEENLTDVEYLKKYNELPFGWIYRNRGFIEKITGEFSYFLNMWIDARKKSPKELYPALKSFVTFIEDAESLCKSKGECFEFWFYVIIASKYYISERKQELNDLSANLEHLQKQYEEKTSLLIGLDDEIIRSLQENDGILQADFIKMFDKYIQSEVSSKLYFMAKSGEIERIKSGRSYILHYKPQQGDAYK